MPRVSRREAIDRLRRRLEAEGAEPGARLPSERDLALLLGCSRETLRAALDALEAKGAVWRHVGRGTFAGARPPGRPIRDRLLLEATSPKDLMDARLALEPGVAAAAARRASGPEITYLRARVTAGRSARDRAACEPADDRFHRAIAEVADNPILVGMLSYLSRARQRTVWQREWDRTYRRLGAEEFRGEHSRQHEGIVDAIAAGDPDGAEHAMRTHLQTISREMLQRDAEASRSIFPPTHAASKLRATDGFQRECEPPGGRDDG